MSTKVPQKQGQTFQHGLRVGVALVPSLLLVAEIGGKVALGVLMVRLDSLAAQLASENMLGHVNERLLILQPLHHLPVQKFVTSEVILAVF